MYLLTKEERIQCPPPFSTAYCGLNQFVINQFLDPSSVGRYCSIGDPIRATYVYSFVYHWNCSSSRLHCFDFGYHHRQRIMIYLIHLGTRILDFIHLLSCFECLNLLINMMYHPEIAKHNQYHLATAGSSPPALIWESSFCVFVTWIWTEMNCWIPYG